MLSRQKTVLCLLHQAGGETSRLNLMKWCFLLAQEARPANDRAGFYQFLPFHLGPFSFLLQHEMGNVLRDGLVRTIGDHGWALTDAGVAAARAASQETRERARGILARYGKLTADQLLDSVYQRYAWYAVNSKRRGTARQRRPAATPAVFTAGYEGLTVDGFLDGLLRAGIQALVDVRRNPTGRQFGFHGTTLSRLCKKIGLEYLHVPELGVPSDWRRDLESAGDYRALMRRYEAETLPSLEWAQEQVAGVVRAKPAVLVCLERDPGMCHRSPLAAALSRRTGLPTVHLQGGTDDCARANPRPDHGPHLPAPFS